MKSTNNNIVIVPVNAKNNGTAYGGFDITTGVYGRYGFTSESAKDIYEKTCDMKGTVVYYHKRFDVCGIVQDTKIGKKPALAWVQKKYLDNCKDDYLNINCEPKYTIDISNETEEAFRGNYNKQLFSVVRRIDLMDNKQIETEKFIELITKKEVETQNKVDETKDSKEFSINYTEEAEKLLEKAESKSKFQLEAGVSNIKAEEEDTDDTLDKLIEAQEEVIQHIGEDTDKGEKSVANKNKSEHELVLDITKNDESAIDDNKTSEQLVNDYKNTENKQLNYLDTSVDEYVSALISATNNMNAMAKKFDDMANSYKEAISKSYGPLPDDVHEKMVCVDNIVEPDDADESTEDNTEDNSITMNNYLYDTMLKVLKTDDTISVPRTYYEGLINMILRNIKLSKDGCSYDSIVKIKFYREAKENIAARVEYNVADEFTRITVIKPYNSIEITGNKLADYEVKFNQWRKMNSFRISD
jgi:hypothetical protein